MRSPRPYAGGFDRSRLRPPLRGRLAARWGLLPLRPPVPPAVVGSRSACGRPLCATPRAGARSGRARPPPRRAPPPFRPPPPGLRAPAPRLRRLLRPRSALPRAGGGAGWCSGAAARPSPLRGGWLAAGERRGGAPRGGGAPLRGAFPPPPRGGVTPAVGAHPQGRPHPRGSKQSMCAHTCRKIKMHESGKTCTK